MKKKPSLGASTRRVVTPLRIFFAFKAPALIIGQMHMQDVHFMQREKVKHFQNGSGGNEMSCRIKHHTTPGKARHIFDGECRDAPVLVHGMGRENIG